MPPTVFTIGHSSHTADRFVAMLRRAGVTAVADVRSTPFSRRYPQFSRDHLECRLKSEGIAYVFLGEELGGRPKAGYYRDGIADYQRIAQTPAYRHGIDRVMAGAKKYAIALMCCERDPLDCHRSLLVSRSLVGEGAHIRHILADGSTMTHEAIEQRLLRLEGRDHDDLLLSPAQRLADAYRSRAQKAAYTQPEPISPSL